ncbi:MAG: FHA domain-containing protein [Azovibrio sp.]|nr:FHA domain-containing protein [Azovibrio sp.]
MITIVRGEIIGGVRLAGRLGEAEAAHAVERCLKRVERVVDGFRGRLLHAGTGQIGAAFPTPEEASLAAIEMQRRVADLPPASGVKLALRLGVHEAASEEQAGRIAAQLLELALPDQILCSREVMVDVAHNIGVRVRDLHQLELSGGEAFQVMELIWHELDAEDMPSTLTSTSLLALEDLERSAEAMQQSLPPHDALPLAHGQPKLCVRYRGKAYLLDEKTPFLTLGREHNNDLVIEDSKASRQHARIERKDGRYYLVDMSTNGTFVTFFGEPELFLRRESLPLRGSGRLCFGVSARDPLAEQAEFEHL